MNMKHRILSVVVVLAAVGVAACESTPQQAAADEQKTAQEKIAKAEKEAAEKTAKAKKEADEKIASAAKELAEKKADVKKDLAEELADIKYQAFVGLSDYKVLVTSRISEHEKKFVELKIKGENSAAKMSADAKKEWNDAVKVAETELKQAREDLQSLDKATEPTWTTVKARVDANVKNFAKSIDNLGDKLQKL
jgi:F0F1-type ATP synthase membrane subunit b/b'